MGVRSYESCGKVTQVTSDIWAGTERVITSIERGERCDPRGQTPVRLFLVIIYVNMQVVMEVR